MLDITLMEQEEPTNAQFSNPLVMTKGFDESFQPISPMVALSTLEKIHDERVNSLKGADYLQVCYFRNKKFWVIDDGSFVTFLLPEEY